MLEDGINNEERAAVAPLFIAGPCELRFRGRKNRGRYNDERGKSWASFFENLNGVLMRPGARPPDRAASGQRLHVGRANNLWPGIFQWLHVFFGITWIGLLYYFNFVQIPTMPTRPAELKPGVSKYIAPKALFYFRWGAAFTVLTGLILAYFTVRRRRFSLQRSGNRLIGIGMWLALIMAFNVWFVIWPNQKRRSASSRRTMREGQVGPHRDDLLADQYASIDPDALAMTAFRY